MINTHIQQKNNIKHIKLTNKSWNNCRNSNVSQKHKQLGKRKGNQTSQNLIDHRSFKKREPQRLHDAKAPWAVATNVGSRPTSATNHDCHAVPCVLIFGHLRGDPRMLEGPRFVASIQSPLLENHKNPPKMAIWTAAGQMTCPPNVEASGG